jgi:hypothetical protein
MERLIDRLIAYFVPAGVPAKTALRVWFREEGYWYLTSALVHAIGFVILAILFAALPEVFPSVFGSSDGKAITLDATTVEAPVETDIPLFEIGQASVEPTILSPDTLLLGPQAPQKALYIDDSDTFEEPGGGKPSDLKGPLLGGYGGFSIPNRPGPAGKGGLGVSSGTGDTPGAGGGLGTGLGGRGKGRREELAGLSGGTIASERAVAGGLNWLARHQAPAGNWSLQHTKHCKGGSCSAPGTIQADAGATAMALLAFQGSGQTHKGKGPYRERVQKAVSWLVKHQNSRTGDLSAGAPQPMYSHGLATIALCEAYGMTRDAAVGDAATKAVRFIEQAQNEVHGGWRYVAHSHDGDTSVLGWQVMALKSAQMAGIGVNSMCFEGARKWLASCSQGQHHGLYIYVPYREVSPSMTAVGMLCQQYMGTARDDPALLEGKQYLLSNLPDANLDRDVYYWYYATLAMHNFMGPEWDRWNRQMRRTLISTQCKGGCAEGSWDPERPAVDKWSQAGRVYVTAMSTLTLEVYYRLMPLYNINQGPQAPPPPSAMGLVIGPPAEPAPEKPTSRTP